MDFLELVQQRQSDRAFDVETAVEAEKIEAILEAARLAPSACNGQPWHFIVVTEPGLRDAVAAATSSRVLGMNHFTRQAPVHILIIEETTNLSSRVGGLVKDNHFPHIDIGIATAHITLAATSLGLGSCIIGWFDQKKIKALLGIPRSKRVLLDVLIGYSTQVHRDKVRKSIETVSSRNKYQG